MKPNKGCKVCAWENDSGTIIDKSKSVRDWAAIVGCGKTTIQTHITTHESQGTRPAEQPVNANYKWEIGEDEFDGNSKAYPGPITHNEVEAFLLSKGLLPAEWDYTFRFSEWEQRTRDGELHTLHAFRVTGKRKKRQADAKFEADYIERIKNWEWVEPNLEPESESFVFVPTDFQIGKSDWNGGTPETIDQVLNSFRAAAEYCIRKKPSEIVIIDAGDIVENIYSTSSQLGTNDLGLPYQVSIAYELMLAGIQMLAPLAPSIKYVSVPSNHGSHRIGPKSPAGAVHDDWGLMLARILDVSANLSPALEHLTVITSDNYTDSLSFETGGSIIGVVHGHQCGSADGIGKWWAGQSHGNMPVARARILITGHWHSFRVQQSGDARWVFVGPASDRGSSWFTNNRGEQSVSGIMGFMTRDNKWSDIQIF